MIAGPVDSVSLVREARLIVTPRLPLLVALLFGIIGPPVGGLSMQPISTAPRHVDDARLRAEAPSLGVERMINRLRLAIILAGSLLFPLIAGEPGTIPWLGYSLLVAAVAYAVGVVVFEPQRRFPILMSVWVTSVSDVLVVLLWIVATGGVDSPWVVSLFAVIGVASLRYRPRDTLVLAALAATAYAAMALALGQVAGNGVVLAVHTLYLVLIGASGAAISRERLRRLASRLDVLDLSQEVAQVGSWEWDLSDGGLSWSRELCRIFEHPPGQEPTVESYFQAIHPDDRDRCKRVIESALSERAPLRFDHRIVTRSGKIRWLHCRGRVLTDASGAPRAVVGSAQDVTDARQMEEQLLVTQKLASLGTLASGIAHEINNPLAYVSSSLALARRCLARPGEKASASATPPAPLGEALSAAQEGCHRVAEIVRGLKIFSQTDDERLGSVDMTRVCDAALAIAAHEIGQRARLVRDYRASPVVAANESRLVQVVLNLVVNAAQAIDRGRKVGNEVRVVVATDSDGRARLEVSDTGCGISPEHVSRVFDPFFTTKSPGGGTGLGLSICHGIVTELGGKLTVRSEVGTGSTFTVVLPAATRQDSLPAAEDPRNIPPEPGPRPSVLVVDDEALYARSLSLLLGANHEVTVASGGRRALELLADRGAFDVILCDLMMAEMSGMDLHDLIAKDFPAMLPRLVFLTGGATTEQARAFLQRADVRYLEKPVDPATLERTIRALAWPRAA
jgi:PAS domain S-box-containing protein